MRLLNNCAVLNKNAIILCDEKKVIHKLSYKEVSEFSEKIQDVLSKYIKSENICLGLLMNQTVYLPSIILSIQKLHCSFVFLTPRNLYKTLDNVKCYWVLSLNDIKELPQFEEVNRLMLGDKILILWKRHGLCASNFKDIFCVVQTSGSTGECKFVKVTNTCIGTNTSNLRDIFQMKSEDVIFWGTRLTFDPSLIELILALQSGACLLIVPTRVLINPKALYKVLFQRVGITFLQIVPSLFLRWSDVEIKQILLHPQLRTLAFGGECFPKRILSYQRGDNLRIFNLYGISEVSCWATLYEITNENVGDDVPIGNSLEATIIELRDNLGMVVDKGKGEIFIGSSSRICYINKEPIAEVTGIVFRETGDIAEVNEKGIFILGRKNKVIKRYGHRINLTKIEDAILRETGLENRCVWSKERSKILTFILIKELDIELKGKILDKLHIKLINILPPESFPDFIDIVINFPLTCHGKINESALERLCIASKTTISYEDGFKQLWCKYVGLSTESIDEIKDYKFLELGGSSIYALQLLTEFKELVGGKYPQELVTMIFENTLKDCLNYLRNLKPLKHTNSVGTEVENTSVKRKTSDDLKIIWAYNLAACVDSSPLIFQKELEIYIAIGSFSHKFVVLNGAGVRDFEITLPDAVESTPCLSPCKNLILVGCYDGAMYCIDYIKKQIVWRFATGNKIKNSVCFCKDGSAVVFGSYDKVLYCVSVMGGSQLWYTLLDGSVSSNPIFDDHKKNIYIASVRGSCYCLKDEDGQIVWKTDCSGPIFGTPCLVNSNDHIIFPVVQGVLHCLKTDSGDILWKYQTSGYVFSSLVLCKNLVLFGCHDNTITVVDVSDSNCTLVNKIVIESKTSTAPFLSTLNGNDVIVTACNAGIIAVIDLNTYETLGTLQLPGEIFSSPVVYNNKIFVGCRDNNFYCIALNK